MARGKSIALPWRPDGPCPCNSGKLLRQCCLSPIGQIRKQIPALCPPAPQTRYSHPHCYLSGTQDCSLDLSAEHYISRSVLEALGNEVFVDGARWLPPGVRRQIGINRLTAKMLCKRHNSSLSPLDTEAGQFFRIIRGISDDLSKRSLSRKDRFYLASGEAIELWMLKAACGLFYSKMAARNRVSLADNHTLDQLRVIDALQIGHWGIGCGLYINAPVGLVVTTANAVSMAPITHQNEKRVVGAALILSGLHFQLLFDAAEADVLHPTPGWLHRPSELIFENERRRHLVVMTWPPGTPQRSIRLTFQGRGPRPGPGG